MHPCAAEIAAAEAALAAGGDRAVGVSALRALHAQAARQLLGAAPGDLLDALVTATAEGVAPLARAAAIAHLRAAEALQWEIGGWSTSAGEGLGSLREVRDLQLARAWLLTVPPAEADDSREAHRLVDAVDADLHRVAAHRQALMARIRARCAAVGGTAGVNPGDGPWPV